MAAQSGERRVTAEVGAELIRLMVPDVDLELVQLLLNHIAHSAEPQAALLQEYAELFALIRDTGIDHAQLSAFLGLNPETPPIDDENPTGKYLTDQ